MVRTFRFVAVAWLLVVAPSFLPVARSTAAPVSSGAAGRDLAPRTLYRSADFARAKRNIARYPWAAEIYARLKSEAAGLLKLDREAIRAFIPKRTPLAAIKCPVCGEAPWSWYNLLEDGAVLECDD